MAATPELGLTGSTQRINADENFGVTNLIYWNSTNVTIIYVGDGHNDGVIGDDIHIRVYTFIIDLTTNPVIQIDSFHPWDYGLLHGEDLFEHFNWYRYNDTSLTTNVGVGAGTNVFGLRMETLNTYYAAGTNGSKLDSLRFTIKNSKLTTFAFFQFNETAYSTPFLAYNSSSLYLSFGLNYSADQSSLNALSLISGLMFWSLPGVPIEVYLIISFVVWPPIIYVAAIWILRIIGSVFGSGGGG